MQGEQCEMQGGQYEMQGEQCVMQGGQREMQGEQCEMQGGQYEMYGEQYLGGAILGEIKYIGIKSPKTGN